MQRIKIWGWEKKQRTMIRYIKNGDIFCFKLDEKSYCFGRIIAETDFGHLAEVFDCISDTPFIDQNNVEKALRLIEPIILDSYSLFDRKTEGEWRIIGHQEEYLAPDFRDIFLTYGIEKDWKKVDLYGNETRISEEEHLKYIQVSPEGDYWVKKLIQDNVNVLKKI